jgi:DNA-binding IclR family transcriptional regulator
VQPTSTNCSVNALRIPFQITAFATKREGTPLATEPSKNSIQVIERMMDLFDALSRHADPVGLKQLAHATGLHPSTAHRILNSLVEYRMVDRIEPGTYRLGSRLMEFGHLAKSRVNLRAEALPFMRQLHQELHETVNLSVRQGDEMVYVERILSDRSAMRVVHLIGARAPLHITAVGKIFLLEEGEGACESYAARNGLRVFTKNTIRDVAELRKELEKVRKLGYALDNEEAENGVCCIGAGIHDDEGRLVAGLSLSVPSNRLNKSWGPLIKSVADRVSRAIGYQLTPSAPAKRVSTR